VPGDEFGVLRAGAAKVEIRGMKKTSNPQHSTSNVDVRGQMRDRGVVDDTVRPMEADWVSLPDEQLLERRISTLGLKLEGTPLEPLIKQLYDELSAHGLPFHPPCHIGDEWFVPIGIPAIFIPFFLVHDRLRAMERFMMLEVEGETPEWFMKLMRHEAGHAYMYAYQLTRRKKWRNCFGQTSDEETPNTYRPRPFSRSYVVHLEDWYAQSHPDEDFAETFAIWLTPGLDWRKRYAGWNALQKLEYVDELMKSLAGKPPVHAPNFRVADYDFLNVKLKTYYARKRKLYEDTYPGFYDVDLRQLFPAPSGIRASSYLRQRRRRLMNSVSQWTNEKKFRVNKLLSRLIDRSDELGLYAHNDDPQQDFRVASYITTLVMNYLFTGKFKRTK
jgi:putative zinc-binding metallo-peptidase